MLPAHQTISKITVLNWMDATIIDYSTPYVGMKRRCLWPFF